MSNRRTVSRRHFLRTSAATAATAAWWTPSVSYARIPGAGWDFRMG